MRNQIPSTDTRIFSVTPLWFMIFILVWLALIRLPDQMPSPDLEFSWASALSYFTARRLQFGREIIFTFGPLGFLYPDVYAGYLFEPKIAFEMFSKALFAFLLIMVTQRSNIVLGILIICSVSLFSPAVMDHMYFFTITYALVLTALFDHLKWLPIAVGFVLSLFSLIKFSFLVPATLGILILSAHWICLREWRNVATMVCSYIAATTSIWIIAGQEATGITQYLQTGLYISAAYTQAMFNEEQFANGILGVPTLLIVGFTLFSSFLHSASTTARTVIVLLIAQGTFFNWKYGFVRADAEHVLQFLLTSQLLLIVVLDVTRPTMLGRRTFFNLTATSLFLANLGLVMTRSNYYRVNDQPQIWRRMALNASAFLNLSDYHLQLEKRLEAAKEQFTLPRVATRIGRETLDVFGHEQGIVFLNNFNYRPRPAFQGYSAHHPFLLRANQAYYQSIAAPKFVLVKLQSLDNRLPTADDSGALNALLSNYVPTISENEYTLWERTMLRSRTPTKLVKEETAAFDETVELPTNSEAIWLSVEWQYTWLGKIIELLYKPNEVTIEITTIAGSKQSFRLIYPLASSSFLIDPLVKNTGDLVAFATGQRIIRTRSFRVRGASHLYQSLFRYKLFARDV